MNSLALNTAGVFAATALGSVGMFYLLNRFVYPHPDLPGALQYNNVLFGDGLVFPTYNSLLYYWIATGRLSFAAAPVRFVISCSFVFIVGYILWRLYINPDNDWSRPRPGRFNGGGIYHVLYFFTQLVLCGSGLALCVAAHLWAELGCFLALLALYGLLALFPTWRPWARKTRGG